MFDFIYILIVLTIGQFPPLFVSVDNASTWLRLNDQAPLLPHPSRKYCKSGLRPFFHLCNLAKGIPSASKVCLPVKPACFRVLGQDDRAGGSRGTIRRLRVLAVSPDTVIFSRSRLMSLTVSLAHSSERMPWNRAKGKGWGYSGWIQSGGILQRTSGNFRLI